MSESPSTNHLRLAHLAAVMRPAFRCPTTPEPIRELYCVIVDALDGEYGSGARREGTAHVDATDAALCAVIMLRNATRATGTNGVTSLGDTATIEADDADPDIGLHLALFGVETMLERLGWSDRRAA